MPCTVGVVLSETRRGHTSARVWVTGNYEPRDVSSGNCTQVWEGAIRLLDTSFPKEYFKTIKLNDRIDSYGLLNDI